MDLRPTRALAAALLLLTLAACAPGDPRPAPTTADPTTASTPTADPTPTASPVTAALDCESLVDPATLAQFAADGVAITDTEEFRQKLQDEGSAFIAFFDSGGVLCQVGGEYYATDLYGAAPLAYGSPGGAALAASLLEDGFVQTSGDGGEYFELPADAEGAARDCYLTSTFSVCAGSNARLEEVRARAGY